ncbi:hypothetical protein [Paenibacillus ferrarius]|uniref:hypothetical protein n=1 Tax=Paenibacillus ferrarius TaxID=1469647 RepID=UPI003D285BA2
MIKRARGSKIRTVGSGKDIGHTGGWPAHEADNAGFALAAAQHTKIFVGPSLEGIDVEYIEIVSGKVSQQQPSFAR